MVSIRIRFPDLTDEGKEVLLSRHDFVLFPLIVGSELSEAIRIKNRDILLLLAWVMFIL